MTVRFDPTRALTVDLRRGQLRDDEGTTRINVPYFLLEKLFSEAGAHAAEDFGRALGTEIGRRIAEGLGREAEEASIATWTEHLGGHVGLIGLGDLSIERWGRALVLRVEGPPEGAASLLGSIVTGALQRALGRSVSVVAFQEGSVVALLVLSAAGAARATALREAGASLGRVAEELHRSAS